MQPFIQHTDSDFKRTYDSSLKIEELDTALKKENGFGEITRSRWTYN